jgi:hypothetical protein
MYCLWKNVKSLKRKEVQCGKLHESISKDKSLILRYQEFIRSSILNLDEISLFLKKVTTLKSRVSELVTQQGKGDADVLQQALDALI